MSDPAATSADKLWSQLGVGREAAPPVDNDGAQGATWDGQVLHEAEMLETRSAGGTAEGPSVPKPIDGPNLASEGQQLPPILERKRMRGVLHRRYGPPEVLRLEEVARPIPHDDDVLVRIHATTVSRTDCALRAATPFFSRFVTGLLRPKRQILGSDLAGEVEEVGATVTEFAVGDHVFGINPWKFGTHAEFTCLRASGALGHMPTGLAFEEAAAVCDGAILALNALRPAQLREGQTILIYGASGSIGSAGVQLARYFGAKVTAVCKGKDAELVRSLGADEVIDYTEQDFTKNGRTYDAILDAVGNLTFSQCRGSLKRGGVYLATDGLQNLALAMWTAWFGEKRVRFSIPPRFTKKDVKFLKELIEAGEYRPVIDRRYPLDQVVEATRYVETKQKTGNVVLVVNGSARS
jgi:NADPH:quinone reductase-like Zn-dependent oxidoreductase